MNIFKRIIDLGTSNKTDPINNRHSRFANSVAIIVSFYIVQCCTIAVYYHEQSLIYVYLAHFALIALIPLFNYLGYRVLASAWFSIVANIFVTFYAFAFTLGSYNFVFLPMIIFLQFFLFKVSEIRYIILFTIVGILCFVCAIFFNELNIKPIFAYSKDFLTAQSINSLIGLPLLSIAFGVYAFSTINKAEKETALAKEKTENLLLNILPEAIAERFKNDQSYLAQSYQSVSVLFADIVGFTMRSSKISPNDLVEFLNEIFSKFDALTESYGLEKIKTIGDSYMVAGGVPMPKDNHINSICTLALSMQNAIKEMHFPNGEPLLIRIGISTGPVTAGVIGVKKFIYDLWGDTVNTASRMESHSEPGAIQITEAVYEVVKDKFNCSPRGTINVKGKGEMDTYFLIAAR